MENKVSAIVIRYFYDIMSDGWEQPACQIIETLTDVSEEELEEFMFENSECHFSCGEFEFGNFINYIYANPNMAFAINGTEEDCSEKEYLTMVVGAKEEVVREYASFNMKFAGHVLDYIRV